MAYSKLSGATNPRNYRKDCYLPVYATRFALSQSWPSCFLSLPPKALERHSEGPLIHTMCHDQLFWDHESHLDRIVIRQFKDLAIGAVVSNVRAGRPWLVAEVFYKERSALSVNNTIERAQSAIQVERNETWSLVVGQQKFKTRRAKSISKTVHGLCEHSSRCGKLGWRHLGTKAIPHRPFQSINPDS